MRPWLIALALLVSVEAWGRYGTGSWCTTCPRDEHGRIKRSHSEVQKFKRLTGHPRGWKGHVVDHIVALACGGCDCVANMQWQTIEDAKAKDKWERNCQ